MSETNTLYTPASASTTVAGNETVLLADEIKKYKTEPLIEYLQKKEDLGLDDDDLEIFCKRKIMGRDFLKMTDDKFERCEFEIGPVTRLIDFAKECKEKKLRLFSYLKEVLHKYSIDSNDIKRIPPFVPETEKISDSDKDFQYCLVNIKRKMGIISPAKSSNKAVRYSYIETILLSAISIIKKIASAKISLELQFEVVGEEATGRVDYAIKKIIDSLNEELICITEGKQN